MKILTTSVMRREKKDLMIKEYQESGQAVSDCHFLMRLAVKLQIVIFDLM